MEFNVELGIIRKTVEMNAIFTEDIGEWEEIKYKEERSQDRALGQT